MLNLTLPSQDDNFAINSLNCVHKMELVFYLVHTAIFSIDTYLSFSTHNYALLHTSKHLQHNEVQNVKHTIELEHTI